MSTKDLSLFESGSGGELYLSNGDLSLSESLYTMVYIALFGGNVEASTIGNEIDSEQRFDYWANSLIFKNKSQKQFNSRTERELRNTAINSSGRLKIQRAIEEDLLFLKNIANISINVLILTGSRIEINISLDAITNQSDKSFQFVWDNAKNEIIINKEI